jgi:hypothetical protein
MGNSDQRGRRLEGWPNTAARLAGWRRLNQQRVILYVMGGPCHLPWRTTPLSPDWDWSIRLRKLEDQRNSESSEEVTKFSSGAMFVFPLTELEEAEGRGGGKNGVSDQCFWSGFVDSVSASASNPDPGVWWPKIAKQLTENCNFLISRRP